MTIDKRTVGFEFSVTVKLVGKHIHNAFMESGENVTMEQFFLLLFLNSRENCTQQDIATIMKKDKSAVLRQTDELEKKKLVVRIPDDEDRRKKILMLTKKGVDTLGRLTAIETSVFETFLKDVSDEDLELLHNVLSKIKSSASKEQPLKSAKGSF